MESYNLIILLNKQTSLVPLNQSVIIFWFITQAMLFKTIFGYDTVFWQALAEDLHWTHI